MSSRGTILAAVMSQPSDRPARHRHRAPKQRRFLHRQRKQPVTPVPDLVTLPVEPGTAAGGIVD